MPRLCEVCAHPDRAEIEKAILARESTREIAERFKVGRMSCHRHKEFHIGAAMVAVVEKRDIEIAAAAGSLSEKLEQIVSDGRRIVAKAEKTGQLSVALAGLRTLTAALEVLGKVTGELQSGTQIAVGLNVNVAREKWNGTDLSVLRWALARHVAQMVTFQPAAIEELRQLAAAPCPECGRVGCQHDPL